MTRLNWITSDVREYANGGGYQVPCFIDIHDQPNEAVGIRRDTAARLAIRTILAPVFRLRAYLFVDGFIERDIGRWIKEVVTDTTVFLEVGCGDGGLRRFLPKRVCYNAFDILLSEFHLKKMKGNINVALASATDIPLESNTVALIVSTECFEHIVDIDRAVNEIHRVAIPGAKLLCSIPNNYCFKYKRKGPHSEHVNNWTYDGFRLFMETHGFRFVRGHMKGFWLPFPLWMTKTSYQLPLSRDSEFLNTNFFFVFEVMK